MKNFKQTPQNGFTLIEVLVVILLIVTLVAVVVGIAQLGHNKSAEAQCITQISDWMNALEDYKEWKGDYPLDNSLLDPAGLQTILNEMYINTGGLHFGAKHDLAIRDPWGMEFRFKRENKHRYILGSLGMDRLIGAGLDDTNAANFKHIGQGDDITNSNGRM